MAWIFTNENIFKMLNQIYQNICDNKGVLFDFNFNDLSISFKYEESDRKIFVKEIITFSKKRILCDEIIVSHPSLTEHDENAINDEGKRIRLIPDLSSGVKELSMSENSLANLLDIEDGFTDFEYVSTARIHRIKKIRNINKKKILNLNLDDCNGTTRRTTADFGGRETVPQLEFFQSTIENSNGDFAEIRKILNLMKERDEVTDVGLHIGYLQDYLKNRAICTLDDKITPREFMIGRIQLQNGIKAIIIEIQR